MAKKDQKKNSRLKKAVENKKKKPIKKDEQKKPLQVPKEICNSSKPVSNTTANIVPVPEEKKEHKENKIINFDHLTGNSSIMNSLEQQMRQIWPFASIRNNNTFDLFEDNGAATPILKSEDGMPSVSTTVNEIARDKTTEFSAVFSEPYMYFLKWQPVCVNNAVIGMQVSKLFFHTYYKNKKKWADFLQRLIDVKDIYISPIHDIAHLGLSVFDIGCFDPLLLQQIDMTIRDLTNDENKEHLQKMIESNETDPFGDMFTDLPPDDIDM